MDQNKRLVLFLLLTGLVWFGWFGFVQPQFFPIAKKAPVADLEERLDDLEGLKDRVDAVADGADAGNEADGVDQEDRRTDLVAPNNPPRRDLKIGSLDPKSGYFQQVTLDSRGAAVAAIELNDPRYRDLDDRGKPLQVVGGGDTPVGTFQMAVAAIDEQLAEFKTDTNRVDWKVERTIPDPEIPGVDQGVVFTLTAPDGSVELVKTYMLRKVEDSTSERSRDVNSDGYILDVEFGFRNLSDRPTTLVYHLQGPEGLPLENETHTSKYRELELGFLGRDGSLSHASMIASDVTEAAEAAEAAAKARAAAAVADRRLVAQQRRIDELAAQVEANPNDDSLKTRLAAAKADLAAEEERARELTDAAQDAGAGLERWSDQPFRYLGVEVQYFAALLLPQDERPIAERFEKPWIASGEPKVIERAAKAEFNDISFALTSAPIVIPPQGEVTQSWSLYAGPKREELLAPLGAEDVLDLSWYAVVSPAMLWVLEKLHSVGLPYWLAIIGLTVIVRGAMFPISRKQAIGAAKMKELQPKLTELKAKYGNDQEKFLRAQMELFRNHGYGPLGPMASGCLPIFLQLPIFIGLYQALQTSVDLRQAEFLWIDNLAAPDELFRMPFALPYLGADFNLLPLITVVLFYIQQKLFMPPATTPEQEAQYKMMNFMMLFMGVFFYHVPAGLCIYFIASSLWSIAERTLLSNTKAAHIGPAEAAEIEHEIEEMEHEKKPPKKKGKTPTKGAIKPPASGEPRKSTWLERLFEAAEQARKQAELGGDKTRPNGPKSKSRPRH